MALLDASFFAEFSGTSAPALPAVIVANNNNRALFITTMVDAVANSITSVTRNGQAAVALTNGNIAASTDVRLQHWVILNPTVGTFSVSATASASGGGYLTAVSTYNTNQSTPNGSVLSATYTIPDNTLAVPTASASDLVLDFVGMSGTQVSTTPGGSQTELFDTKTAYYRAIAASVAQGTAANVSMSQLCSSSSPVAVIHSAFVVNDGGSTPPAATAPNAPTIGTATAGNGQVSVAFSAPASNGGSAITGYAATLYKVSDNTVAGTNTGATSPIVVTSTNGVAVYAKAKATNTVGTGPESAASNSVTPSAANQAPIFTGTIANITGTNGVAITPVDVHALYSDPDANTLTYSASPAGTTWPAGLVVNATTGVISGTVATSTTTGLRVRASDGSLTVDSNAFSITISAAGTNKTYTSAVKLTRINGGAAAGVSMTAIVSQRDGPYLGTKTGIITGSTGTPAPFTATFGTVGTSTRIAWIEESAPDNPAPTENVTPT